GGLGAAPWVRAQAASTLAADVPQGPQEGERRLATVTAADRAPGPPPSSIARTEQTPPALDSSRRGEGGPPPVPLTPRRGPIPVRVNNASEERVTGVLRLTSPKVDLPAAGDPFVLEPGRRTTQLLPVGTRATGTFPTPVAAL